MTSFQNVGQALLIAGQAPKATHSPNASLDHPSPWEQHEAALDPRQSNTLQVDSVGGGGLPGRFPGISRVDVGQGDRLPGRRLDCAREVRDLGPVLLVGWGHVPTGGPRDRRRRGPCCPSAVWPHPSPRGHRFRAFTVISSLSRNLS